MKQLGQTAAILIIVALVVGFLLGWALGRNMHSEGEARTATTTPATATTTAGANGGTTVTPNMPSNTTGINIGNLGAAAAFNGTPDLTVVGTGSVRAEDQKAGMSVVVSSVQLASTGWVAIREEGAANRSGNILGAQRLPAGTHTNVNVQLLRATKAGTTYYVTLYKDNGNGTFQKSGDALIIQDGNLVIDTFRAQ